MATRHSDASADPPVTFRLDLPVQRYSEQGHSVEDTLDKVNADSLNQSATVLAVSGLFFADVPDLPCIHFSPEQTAASLIAGKQKPMLEALGLALLGNHCSRLGHA